MMSEDANIEWLLNVLPRLIRENDTVKGAILTALSGVVATSEDIKNLMVEMDKRFEDLRKELNPKFKSIDQKIDSIDDQFKEMNSRFDSIDGEFDNQKSTNKLLFQRIEGLSFGNAMQFEIFCINFLKQKENVEYIDLRRYFKDPEQKVHEGQGIFEIDLFHEDPLIIAECTLNYNKPGKIQKFIKKCQFLENKLGNQAKKYFFSMAVQPELEEELTESCRQENIWLVVGKLF